MAGYQDPQSLADQITQQQHMALADAIRKQSMEQSPTEYAAGGRAVVQSPLIGLSKLAQALIAHKMDTSNAAERMKMAQDSNARLIAALNGGNLPTQSVTSPQSDNGVIPTQDSTVIPNAPVTQENPQSTNQFHNQQNSTPFTIANLLRGNAISQLGGDQANAAYWKNTAPELTEATRLAMAAGLNPAQANADTLTQKNALTIPTGGTIIVNGKPVYGANLDKGIGYDTGADGKPSAYSIPNASNIAAGNAANIKNAEMQATNKNTLAPIDRVNPKTGQPYNNTVADLVSGAHTGGLPFASTAQIESAKTRATGAESAGQAYQNALNDKVESEFQLVNRNNQISPLLDKFQTGGFAPEERLHFANSIANSGLLSDATKSKLSSWVAGGDVTTGNVIANQLASAGISTMLQTLDKEGKPNQAIFRQVQAAAEGLKSGNTTLKDVFELQNRLYHTHYDEQQALNKSIKSGEYNPQTWAGDYSALRHQGLQTVPAPLPGSSVNNGIPSALDIQAEIARRRNK